MTDSIFAQDFDQLLSAVGVGTGTATETVNASSQQTVAQPTQQTAAQPAQQTVAQPAQQTVAQSAQRSMPSATDTTVNIFEQFSMPQSIVQEAAAVQPVQPSKDDYKVDVDVFGAQVVDPSIAPTATAQEVVENASAVTPTTQTAAPTTVQTEAQATAPAEQAVTADKPVADTTEASAKPKTKAKSKAKSKAKDQTPLLDSETIAEIEEQIDIIVRKAVRKSLVKSLKTIADEM